MSNQEIRARHSDIVEVGIKTYGENQVNAMQNESREDEIAEIKKYLLQNGFDLAVTFLDNGYSPVRIKSIY